MQNIRTGPLVRGKAAYESKQEFTLINHRRGQTESTMCLLPRPFTLAGSRNLTLISAVEGCGVIGPLRFPYCECSLYCENSVVPEDKFLSLIMNPRGTQLMHIRGCTNCSN